jgi:hypothetical protein
MGGIGGRLGEMLYRLICNRTEQGLAGFNTAGPGESGQAGWNACQARHIQLLVKSDSKIHSMIGGVLICLQVGKGRLTLE